MERVTRYLLSNSNLAGCGGAAAVVALYLTGLSHNYWAALAVVGYGAGYVAMLRPGPAHLVEGVSTYEGLVWLRSEALPKLPADAGTILASIIATTEELMPRLKEMEGQGLVQVQNRALLKQTITRFLPDALESYLKLPTLYARNTKVDGNKTATHLLVEQLTLLNEHVTEIRDGILSEEVNSLLTNGRFLQEKFDRAFRISK